jgi:hypothetical protein
VSIYDNDESFVQQPLILLKITYIVEMTCKRRCYKNPLAKPEQLDGGKYCSICKKFILTGNTYCFCCDFILGKHTGEEPYLHHGPV